MKAMVLCAGRGTRLGTLTRETPKPMLPLAGEPLLAHTLRYLASHGIEQVAVNLHHLGERIIELFGDGRRYGVTLHYSREKELLGTAGAVKRLEPFFAGEEAFLVLYGDLLLDVDLGAMLAAHRDRQAAATLLLHQRPGSNSLVRMEPGGRITGFVERPSETERAARPYAWVNSGVQVLGPRILSRLPEGPADLPRDIYVPLVKEERIFGHPLDGYRCAIDSPERYARADADLRAGRCRRPEARGAET